MAPKTEALLEAVWRTKTDAELLTGLAEMHHHGVDPECPDLKAARTERERRGL